MRFLLIQVPHFFIILFFLETGINAANGISKLQPCFWEQEINAAIVKRNHAFTLLVPDSAGINILLWNEQLKAAAMRNILSTVAACPVWNNVIRGMLLYSSDSTTASNDFHNALSCAAEDPGSTWLLFIEFNRYNLTTFSEKALIQLEKQMFTAGATTAQIIARHLLHYGIEQKINSNKNRAAHLYSWAHRFDKNETASIFQAIMIALPFNLTELQNAFTTLFATLSSSWVSQLSCVATLYYFLRFFLTLFVIFMTFIFCSKYFPKALHTPAHFYPGKVAPPLRLLLASCSIVSLVCFGFIPFFWLVTFLFWRFLSRNEMILHGIALIIVTLSPLDTIIFDGFQMAQHPEGPLLTLSKSLNEGNTHAPITVDALDEKDENRARIIKIVAVVDAVKRNDLQQAWLALHASTPSSLGDPVVDNMKGIVHVFGGTIDSAVFYFKKVLSYNPNNYYAQFNLSRCSILSNDATGGMEYLEHAAAMNPGVINTFIQINDNYFSDNWPLLRRVIFPDYTPRQFWSRLFLPLTVTASSHRLQWGLAFFGLPPLVSLGIFVVFIICLIWYHSRIHSGRKPRHFFECKYCGRIICRNCTTGILCPSCSTTTQHLKTRTALDQTRNKLIVHSSATRHIQNAFFNLVVPGSGIILDLQPQYVKAFISLVASCFIYSWWFLVIGNATTRWMTINEVFLLFLLPIFFHGYALFRFLPVIIWQSKVLIAAAFSPEVNK